MLVRKVDRYIENIKKNYIQMKDTWSDRCIDKLN